MSKKSEQLKFHLQEQIIVNLQSLAEVRSTLIGLLKIRNQAAFEVSIRDLWLPINSHIEIIAKLRNQFIAHSGHKDDKFLREHPLEMIQSKQFPTQYAEILLLALCAFHYILFFQEEFRTEREVAEMKWKKRTADAGGIETGSLKAADDVLSAHKRIAEKVRVKVEGAGFVFQEPSFN